MYVFLKYGNYFIKFFTTLFLSDKIITHKKQRETAAHAVDVHVLTFMTSLDLYKCIVESAGIHNPPFT